MCLHPVNLQKRQGRFWIICVLVTMWSNFHTHTHYCDGKGTVADYCRAAQQQNVSAIGFSSHAPLPFPCKWCMKQEMLQNYLLEIIAARQAFPEVEIYSGLEIDYVPGVISPADFRSTLDYTIGSIHFVGCFGATHWEIDNTLEVFREGLTQIFNGNIREAVSEYFRLTREMVMTSPPDIVGHLDKIKINAIHFNFSEAEPWYIEEMEKTIESIFRSGSIVEVNTRGIYKKKSTTTYPSPWVLERILQRNIPVTISSDAHHPADLTREFVATATLLKDLGFTNISIFKDHIWKTMPLNEYDLIR